MNKGEEGKKTKRDINKNQTQRIEKGSWRIQENK